MKIAHFSCDVLMKAYEQERDIKQFLLQQARVCGPSVARLIRHVWADSILELGRDARELIALAQRYSPGRLEAACRRALYYRKDRNFSVISWILEHQYDQFPLSPYTDIQGQFLFRFEPCSEQHLNNVESRIMWETKAV